MLKVCKNIIYKDFTIAHYDFSPWNMLYDKKGKITAIVDFDQAHRDIMQLDLIKAIRFFAEDKTKTKIDFKKAEYFIKEYLKKNPIKLKSKDIYYFMLFILMRRLYYMLEIYYTYGWKLKKE